ncbi:hypothetical protein C8T65DRAFT_545922, partial [Cerioporus squamosus]
WAQANKRRNWDTIFWTDETRLELGERPRREHVTQKAGEESGRKSIMLWGCVAQGCKGPFIWLDL